MIAVQVASLIAALILLAACAVRVRRTPPAHPDRSVRGDVTMLMALLAICLAISLTLTHFFAASPSFALLNLSLLLPGAAAVFMVARIVRSYRQAAVVPPEQALPDIDTVQSRLRRPPDGNKR